MSEWISVKDKLPKKNELVWIYWRDREVLIGYRYHHEDEYDPEEGWISVLWVSVLDEKARWANYWMPIPIPKPPKE